MVIFLPILNFFKFRVKGERSIDVKNSYLKDYRTISLCYPLLSVTDISSEQVVIIFTKVDPANTFARGCFNQSSNASARNKLLTS